MLLLIDSDDYTASVLLAELAKRGFDNTAAVSRALDLPKFLGASKPDAVIFNYQSDKPDSLNVCTTIRLLAPQAAVIAIVSPGPALKALRVWSEQTQCIDAIIEKPLSDERFFMTLNDMLKVKVLLRDLQNKTQRLSNLLPEGALAVVDGAANNANEAEFFEGVVLFTDIRESSQLIRKMPPRDFFQLLNDVLSAQAGQIAQHQGAVVKYTGDGLMAVFRGMGRSYLALRCALALASLSDSRKVPFGVGVAEGLLLAGLIGDFNQAGKRRQYDVIGATANLSARLCSMAGAGEVIATRSINMVAKVSSPEPRAIGSVSVKGFDAEIDCVAFNPSNNRQEQGV